MINLIKFSKSMTELSPFSVFLIISQCKLVNKISQEPLELGYDIWITDCV